MPPVVMAAALVAGAGIYASNASSRAEEKAANAQRDVAMAQLQATKDAETLAAETAKQQLKLRQASKSNTILTGPMTEEASINKPSILGVPGA